MAWILSHVLRKTLCEHVNGWCPAGWPNEQSITKHWFQSVRTCPYSWDTDRNSISKRPSAQLGEMVGCYNLQRHSFFVGYQLFNVIYYPFINCLLKNESQWTRRPSQIRDRSLWHNRQLCLMAKEKFRSHSLLRVRIAGKKYILD